MWRSAVSPDHDDHEKTKPTRMAQSRGREMERSHQHRHDLVKENESSSKAKRMGRTKIGRHKNIKKMNLPMASIREKVEIPELDLAQRVDSAGQSVNPEARSRTL
jgi:hypothetical protein